jgi:hypothetical protein
MTKISSLATAAALASLLLTGSAFAQTAAPAKDATKTETKAPAPAPAEKKAEKPRTAASLECSKEADAKGLHGKERKKFRSECKKGGADKAK